MYSGRYPDRDDEPRNSDEEELLQRGLRDAENARLARSGRRFGAASEGQYGSSTRGEYLASISTGVASDSDEEYDYDESGSQSDNDEGYDARGGIDLNDVEDYWPRYLLYVDGDNLETYPCQDEFSGSVTYGGIENPIYSILSYTWGRWQAKGNEPSSAISIQGLEWTVPPIKLEDGFSAESFLSVLQKITGGQGFVWVDVGCIPQLQEPGSPLHEVYMDEIGHQAGIFKKAQKAYIWLHHVETHLLQAAQNQFSRNDFRGAHAIMTDPWFTSLWTLQEAYLRTDAELLSVHGITAPAQSDPSRPFQLQDLIRLFYRLLHNPQRQTFYMDYRNCGLELLQSKNPLTLLGISRHRTAYSPPDHVLGIMQIFGFRLTADPIYEKDHYMRQELLKEQQRLLEHEMCIEINKKSLVIAHAFTRFIQAPRGFPSWAYYLGTPENIVTGRSYEDGHGVPVAPQDPARLVPEDFWHIREEPHVMQPRISFSGKGREIMEFDGLAGEFELLLDGLVENGITKNTAIGSIYLDRGRHDTSDPFTPIGRDPRNQPRANPIEEAQKLLDRNKTRAPGQVHEILFMGNFTAGPSRRLCALALMVTFRRYVQERPQFKRIGFCTFSADMVDRIMTKKLQCDLI